jgi:hypothetical protein
MPGVTLTFTSSAVRLASSLRPAASTVWLQGPMNEARVLERAHEVHVLGHEAVAREDVLVAVLAADADHLRHALLTLFLGGARVVRDGVDVLGVQHAQLGGERARVHDAVLLAEQDADVLDAHLAEDVDGLLADGAAADDEHAHVFAGELAHPAGLALAQATVAVDQRIVGVGVVGHQKDSRCTDCMGPTL